MGNELDKPHLLTEDKQLTIVEVLSKGNYLTVACTRAGISVDCFNYWRKLWETGHHSAQKYDKFFRACRMALAEAEVNALDQVRAGQSGWQGNAWYLERRFPTRWGKQDRAPVPTPDKNLKDMTDEELAKYQRDLERKS
jgi:hypothetical protein